MISENFEGSYGISVVIGHIFVSIEFLIFLFYVFPEAR